MTRQKAAYLLMFVRAVIIHDQVQFDIGLKFSVELAQKFDKLLVTVARVTLSAYLATDDVECGKQGRCSVSDVIVRPGAAAALFERQPRLSTIQRLNLRFFIHTAVGILPA